MTCAVRVGKRKALRRAGLRPVLIFVPDTRAPGFDAECRRQASLAAAADRREPGPVSFAEAAAIELDGWER